MALAETNIERLILAAGYDPATEVAVGVCSPAETLLVGNGGLDCDSVAYGGSLAKQITAACAVLLAQEGTLEVEAPIAEWLPRLPSWAQTVRVRHLVHHTAGLPPTDAVWDRMSAVGERDWTSDGVLAALASFDELDEPPGATYAYSNAGYICLARIVERLGGTGLDGFARDRLFEPLGMPSTCFWSGPSPAPPTAGLARPFEPPAPLSLGDGGLWTTVRDLLRWCETMIEDTLGVAATLHTPGRLDDGTPLDYAWGVRVFDLRGNRVESHGGSWEGATSKLVRLPELRRSFAVLAGDGSVERMTDLSSRLQDAIISSS